MNKILISNSNGIHSLVNHGLESMGMDVTAITDATYDDALKLTTADKVQNVLKKISGRTVGINALKKRKSEAYYTNRKKELASQNLDFDCAFLIAPQSFDRSLLEPILKNIPKKIAYHWDGIHRFPEMTKNDDFFERIYVFDPADADFVKYFPATNCYFDDSALVYAKEFDLYYNTFFSKTKIKHLNKVLHLFPEMDFKINVRVFNAEEYRLTEEELGNKVSITYQTENYRSILNTTQKSRVLLDIKAEEHNGLSFRFFEALCYRCKLVTNNAAVKEYDFYRPENIFVFTGNTKPEEIKEFLNLPYKEVPEEVRLRYYFPIWFHRMTDF